MGCTGCREHTQGCRMHAIVCAQHTLSYREHRVPQGAQVGCRVSTKATGSTELTQQSAEQPLRGTTPAEQSYSLCPSRSWAPRSCTIQSCAPDPPSFPSSSAQLQMASSTLQGKLCDSRALIHTKCLPNASQLPGSSENMQPSSLQAPQTQRHFPPRKYELLPSRVKLCFTSQPGRNNEGAPAFYVTLHPAPAVPKPLCVMHSSPLASSSEKKGLMSGANWCWGRS